MFNALYGFTLAGVFASTLGDATENLLTTVGLVTLLVGLGLAAIYYLLINRVTDKFDQVIHWFIVMDIVLVFAGVFAWWQAHAMAVETASDVVPSVPVLFWVMNIIYAGIYYFIGSLAFRKLSKFATKIPF